MWVNFTSTKVSKKIKWTFSFISCHMHTFFGQTRQILPCLQTAPVGSPAYSLRNPVARHWLWVVLPSGKYIRTQSHTHTAGWHELLQRVRKTLFWDSPHHCPSVSRHQKLFSTHLSTTTHNLSQGWEEAAPKTRVKEDAALESQVISCFLMVRCLPGSKTVQTWPPGLMLTHCSSDGQRWVTFRFKSLIHGGLIFPDTMKMNY